MFFKGEIAVCPSAGCISKTVIQRAEIFTVYDCVVGRITYQTIKGGLRAFGFFYAKAKVVKLGDAIETQQNTSMLNKGSGSVLPPNQYFFPF